MSGGALTIADIKNETELPAVIIDYRGCIFFVNRPFEAIFGWQTQDIIGKPVTTIIPSVMNDAPNLGFSRFLTTGQPNILNQFLNLTAMNRAGEVFKAEHYITAEQQNDEWVIGATIRPL